MMNVTSGEATKPLIKFLVLLKWMEHGYLREQAIVPSPSRKQRNSGILFRPRGQ